MRLALLDKNGEEVTSLGDINTLVTSYTDEVLGQLIVDTIHKYDDAVCEQAKTCNVAVELHGGTILGVMTDSPFKLRVVFTEDRKYRDNDNEFYIDDGFESFVHSDVEADQVTTEELQPVLTAADKRIEAFKQEDDQDGKETT